MTKLITKKTGEMIFISPVKVDPQGFEPQLMVPKTRVLPLHHGSVLFW